MTRIPLTDEDIYPYDMDIRINVGGLGEDNHNRQIALKKQILDDHEFYEKIHESPLKYEILSGNAYKALKDKSEKWNRYQVVGKGKAYDIIKEQMKLEAQVKELQGQNKRLEEQVRTRVF